MTSAKFQTLGISERHEALSAMTIDQLIDFTETFAPLAGLPAGAESCWRTLALRLAIELREKLALSELHQVAIDAMHRDLESLVQGGPCDCCIDDERQADPDVMTRELESLPASSVALARAAGGLRL